jgi:DNA-directed RNA polymerase subunit K/omega
MFNLKKHAIIAKSKETIMIKGNAVKQTGEEDIAKLVEMAKDEIASGKVKYISLARGQKAE